MRAAHDEPLAVADRERPIPPSRVRDRIAMALLAYGLVGVALLLLTLFLTLVSLGTVEQLARSVDSGGPEGVAARLAPIESTLAEAEIAIVGFDATLDGTAAAMESGRALTSGLAEALRRLASSLDVVVLGTRPFAGLGAEFSEVAANADALATDLGQTSVSLAANREALGRLAGELADLRAGVAALRAELGATEGGLGDGPASGQSSALVVPAAEAFTLSRIVLVALLAWLAVPPVAAVSIALRRLRDPGTARW